MQIVRSLEETNWRRFVTQHPAGSIFHTPEMFGVFQQAKGHRPTTWATIDSDGEILALLLPVQITLRGGLLRYLTTRAVAYGSVLCAPGLRGEEALSLLLRTYAQQAGRATLFTELRNLSSLDTLQPILCQFGFAYEDHLDYLVDLQQPPESLMRNIAPKTRKHIRRALRKDRVRIEEVQKREQVDVCYDLLRRTYLAARVPLADCSLFRAAFDILYPKGMIRFTLACVDEVPVAISVDLLYKDVVYGWYGGMDRAYSSYTPNELLTWHILGWSVRNGYHVYDFGGAGKPGQEYGVRDFKAKFGGQLVCYGRNTLVHAPIWFAISKRGYQLCQRGRGVRKPS